MGEGKWLKGGGERRQAAEGSGQRSREGKCGRVDEQEPRESQQSPPPGPALPCTQVVGPEGAAGPGPPAALLTKPELCCWLSGPPIPEVLTVAAGPGSVLRLPEAPGLSRCPDLMSSSLESEEGPGRKETC